MLDNKENIGLTLFNTIGFIVCCLIRQTQFSLIIAVWLFLCIAIAFLARGRHYGFVGSFLACFFLSPIIGAIISFSK